AAGEAHAAHHRRPGAVHLALALAPHATRGSHGTFGDAMTPAKKGAGKTGRNSGSKSGRKGGGKGTKKGAAKKGGAKKGGAWDAVFAPRAPGEQRYWLVKSEPEVFSFDDMLRIHNKTTHWNGIRNF